MDATANPKHENINAEKKLASNKCMKFKSAPLVTRARNREVRAVSNDKRMVFESIYFLNDKGKTENSLESILILIEQ